MGDTEPTERSVTSMWGDPESGTTFASTDATGIWYADTGGAGEALVFLHGFSGSSAAAAHLAARTSEAGLRFIAPDLRGHGLSDKPTADGAYHIERFVDDVVALLDEIGIERVHLVGHCMGGMVAAACAAAVPARVVTLALVGTSLQPASDLRMAWLRRAPIPLIRSLARRLLPAETNAARHVDYRAFRDTSDLYWPRLVADYRALSGETAFAILERLDTLDLLETVGAIEAPVLVVHGDGDSVFPPASAVRTTAALGDARLLILPDDNHVSLVFRAESVLFEALLDFVGLSRPQ
ncbi:MAG: alpha/beta hydrolase [Coriobacteriia bacterium]|nr:alpha/beta hydrolase [Coriobacteriia bacterium]